MIHCYIWRLPQALSDPSSVASVSKLSFRGALILIAFVTLKKREEEALCKIICYCLAACSSSRGPFSTKQTTITNRYFFSNVSTNFLPIFSFHSRFRTNNNILPGQFTASLSLWNPFSQKNQVDLELAIS